MEADAAEYVYVAMEVQPDRLSAAVRGLVALGFVGFNVTMPHKEAILPLMDKVDTPARLAGAVNTVSVADEGRLRGLNTDGSGFVEACKEVAVSLEGRRVLVLGAGGTAAAIAVAAFRSGRYTTLYRQPDCRKGRATAVEAFGGRARNRSSDLSAR
jgi:shikimate dehydrogenase